MAPLVGFEMRRRAVIVGLAIVASAGCVGDELDHDDDVPHPLDEDDETAPPFVDILEFAEESTATLERATDRLEEWLNDPEAVSVETLEDVRIQTTAAVDEYDRLVAPNSDAVRDRSAGDSLNGDTWPADGDTIADLLETHDSLHFQLQDATVEVVDVGGDPGSVAGTTIESIESAIEDAPDVIAATEEALAGWADR